MPTFILKQNSESIRKQIEEAGIHVCICCSFRDACWLHYGTSVPNGVHEVGCYSDDVGTKNQEEALALFLHECTDPVWCNSTEEFIEKIKQFELTIKKKKK